MTERIKDLALAIYRLRHPQSTCGSIVVDFGNLPESKCQVCGNRYERNPSSGVACALYAAWKETHERECGKSYVQAAPHYTRWAAAHKYGSEIPDYVWMEEMGAMVAAGDYETARTVRYMIDSKKRHEAFQQHKLFMESGGFFGKMEP